MYSARLCLIGLTFLIPLTAQSQQSMNAMRGNTASPQKTPYYIDSSLLHLGSVIADPATPGSPANTAELQELHSIQEHRTAADVAKAVADDAQENMFAFATVFGPGFTSTALPITAALGQHVKNEQSVIGGELKRHFQRPRPYAVDSTLRPVCPTKPAQDSYPSGHALTGYLEAFTLIELVPEKRAEILERADQFAHNRLVCGVHYPSDIEASRRVAYAIFGDLLATPRFQQDAAAAREELRAKLGLAKTQP